jgi:hypothetical protein
MLRAPDLTRLWRHGCTLMAYGWVRDFAHLRAAQRAQTKYAGPARNGAGGNAAQAALAIPYQTPRDTQRRVR